VRRREFTTLLGGAAATWPLSARAQQPAMPVIGLLSPRAPGDDPQLLTAFRQGLKDAGFVEGQNVAIEYRWAEGHYNRLPALALTCRCNSRLMRCSFEWPIGVHYATRAAYINFAFRCFFSSTCNYCYCLWHARRHRKRYNRWRIGSCSSVWRHSLNGSGGSASANANATNGGSAVAQATGGRTLADNPNLVSGSASATANSTAMPGRHRKRERNSDGLPKCERQFFRYDDKRQFGSSCVQREW
jgi:hypothetical protein